jgi:CelD/BcsL family acetyltransferase involved in cellulose biosynthesis
MRKSTDMQNHRARSGQIHFIQSWHQTGGSPAVGASAPDGGTTPFSYKTSSSRPQTVTSLHSHDVFFIVFFVFLKKKKKKKERKKEKKEKRKSARKAQSRSTKL